MRSATLLVCLFALCHARDGNCNENKKGASCTGPLSFNNYCHNAYNENICMATVFAILFALFVLQKWAELRRTRHQRTLGRTSAAFANSNGRYSNASHNGRLQKFNRTLGMMASALGFVAYTLELFVPSTNDPVYGFRRLLANIVATIVFTMCYSLIGTFAAVYLIAKLGPKYANTPNVVWKGLNIGFFFVVLATFIGHLTGWIQNSEILLTISQILFAIVSLVGGILIVYFIYNVRVNLPPAEKPRLNKVTFLALGVTTLTTCICIWHISDEVKDLHECISHNSCEYYSNDCPKQFKAGNFLNHLFQVVVISLLLLYMWAPLTAIKTKAESSSSPSTRGQTVARLNVSPKGAKPRRSGADGIDAAEAYTIDGKERCVSASASSASSKFSNFNGNGSINDLERPSGNL